MPALLSNVSNPLLSADLVASSVRAAIDTARPKIAARQGMGRVAITGGFTGFSDADLDIEITGGAGSVKRVSEPLFIGSGSGTITAVSAESSAVAQRVDIALSDAGTVTKAAELDFFGVRLKARPAIVGTDGNAILIVVSTAGITLFATAWSTIEDLAKDAQDLKGPQYTWGSLPLLGDGTMNPATVRFTFGDDPTVYREYSVFENGETIFKLDRPLLADVKKGTPLKSVTGTYTVTITRAVTTETYTNIVTLYDFLSKVKASSNLVEVDGVVIDDRTPGGMAMDEFPLRTGAYALATSCSSEVGSSLSGVTVTADCPGQLVEIKCTDNAVVGAEKWDVTAPSEGGPVGEAVSGVAFSAPHFGFTVPKVIPDNPRSVGMDLKLKSVSFAGRAEGEEGTKICIDVPTCGINAKAKTITLVYTKAPTEACECKNADYEGFLNENCLGIEVDSAEGGAMDANLKTCLESLYSWKKAFDRANTSLPSGAAGARSASYDLTLSQKIADIFHDCIVKAYADSTARTQWNTDLTTMQSDITTLSGLQTAGGVSVATPGSTYTEGDYVIPPAHLWNGHKYRCDSRTTSIALASGNGTSATLGYDPISEWPIDGGQTALIRHDVYGGSPVTHYVGFTDAGPIGDVDLIYNSDAGAIRSSISEFVKRYSSAMDYVLALAGIDPKNDAGGQGNECWQERDDEYYWTVNGLEYLPAYTNVVYHSCKGNSDRTEITCTKEFAFVVKCVCEGGLKEGDTIELEITGENTGNKSYQVGDTYSLPIIAGAPVYFAGGVTGNDTLTWSVRGSVSGALTPLSFSADASADYNLHGLHFILNRGSVPFALNDQFSFAVEGGQFRYRFDSGAWSAAQDIPTAPIALANGLSATFVAGAEPSFVSGDLFEWRVLQPYSPQNALQPGYRQYEWQGAGCTLTFDMGDGALMDGFALGLHRLPAAATLLLEGLDGAGDPLWSETLAWRSGIIATLFDTQVAVALRLTVGNATGGSIGWIWAGDPLRFRNPPSDMTLTRNWQTADARYLGSGAGGSLTWDGDRSFLYQPEIDDLLAMLDYAKSNHDQPLILIPNPAFPSDARLVRFDGDSFEWSEWFNFQVRDDATDDYRVIGTRTLPFVGVIA